MKKLFLAVALTVVLGLTAFGSTTDELTISSGATTITITDNGAGDGNSANGAINYNNANFNGWVITVVAGLTNSPGQAPALDLASLTATCAGGTDPCSANSLDIKFGDINFSPASPSFQTDYSATISGTGSTSESAYYSNSNTILAETTLIGTVGPFTGTNHGSVTGGVGSVAPFSLTLDQVFTDASHGAVTFSVDGNVGAVPEPAAVMLLGTVLVFCATKLRRRRAA